MSPTKAAQGNRSKKNLNKNCKNIKAFTTTPRKSSRQPTTSSCNNKPAKGTRMSKFTLTLAMTMRSHTHTHTHTCSGSSVTTNAITTAMRPQHAQHVASFWS